MDAATPAPGTPAPGSNRRRHPAASARRLAGWAAVASSAALVGYMVTANADSGSTQPVVTTQVPQAQPQQQIPASSAESDDDSPTPTVATQPPPTPLPSQAQPAAPVPHARPNSSSHGS